MTHRRYQHLRRALKGAKNPRIRAAVAHSLLTNPTTLAQALAAAASKKGSHVAGPDGVLIHELTAEEREVLLESLGIELRQHYKAGDFNVVPKNSDARPRQVCVFNARDRVVQRALATVLGVLMGPPSAANFSATASGRPAAILELAAVLAQYNTLDVLVLRTDIQRCFDSTRIDMVMRAVARHVGHGRFTGILRSVLKAFSPNGIGIAQGSPLSPVLLDCILRDCDDFFAWRQTVWYARYVDDFVAVVECSRERADGLLAELTAKIGRGGYKLNAAKTKVVRPEEGFEYLGVHIRRTDRGVTLQPCTEAVRRLDARLANQTREEALQATARWADSFAVLGAECHEAAAEMAAQSLANRNIPYGNDTKEHAHRQRIGTGTTRTTSPARASGLRSSVGAPVFEKQLDLASATNMALGEIHDEVRALRTYWGARLNELQVQIAACRLDRRRMRGVLVDFPRGEADRVLARTPAHLLTLKAEHAAKEQARKANEQIAALDVATEQLELEMRARAQRHGVDAAAGRLRQLRFPKRPRAPNNRFNRRWPQK